MKPILPGGTIGVLGGGQLARMIALEARRMGYRVGVLDPDSSGSGAQFSDFCVTGRLDDVSSARALAKRCDVVTLDTEHVPVTVLAELEELVPVRPGAHVLGIVQDRFRQRSFLAQHGIAQPAFVYIHDEASLERACQEVEFPAVLKTTHFGYDGKGQARVASVQALRDAWVQFERRPTIVEQFIDFEREVSVLLARDFHANVVAYPVVENDHCKHVLHRSLVPARVSAEVQAEAHRIGERIAAAFAYVGLMAVEFFVTPHGRLLVNEIAPRTHNSGHFTLGACATSQFEQHVRAICGLPLGPATLLRPAAMVNLFGDLWRDGAPDWLSILAEHPTAQLHLYGKDRAVEGRKMGHILLLSSDAEADVEQEAEALRAKLGMAD